MIQIIESGHPDRKTVPMKDMKPLQIGIYDGKYVMRTASSCHFEIMELSPPHNSWTMPDSGMKVELLAPGERIVIEIFN